MHTATCKSLPVQLSAHQNNTACCAPSGNVTLACRIRLHPASRRLAASGQTAVDVVALVEGTQTPAAPAVAQGPSALVEDGLGLRLSGREKAGLTGS